MGVESCRNRKLHSLGSGYKSSIKFSLVRLGELLKRHPINPRWCPLTPPHISTIRLIKVYVELCRKITKKERTRGAEVALKENK